MPWRQEAQTTCRKRHRRYKALQIWWTPAEKWEGSNDFKQQLELQLLSTGSPLGPEALHNQSTPLSKPQEHKSTPAPSGEKFQCTTQGGPCSTAPPLPWQSSAWPLLSAVSARDSKGEWWARLWRSRVLWALSAPFQHAKPPRANKKAPCIDARGQHDVCQGQKRAWCKNWDQGHRWDEVSPSRCSKMPQLEKISS